MFGIGRKAYRKSSQIFFRNSAHDGQGQNLKSKNLIGMMEEVEDCACIGLSCKCGCSHIYMNNIQGERMVLYLDGTTPTVVPAAEFEAICKAAKSGK